MKTISLTMIVKNEERNLQACLDSVIEFINEIIIVDTGSTDNTKEIAKKNNVKLFDYHWTNDFSAARNFALEKSTSDWAIVLDGDEYVQSWNSTELDGLIYGGTEFIGNINIISSFLTNGEKRFSQTNVPRLIPKGTFFIGKIHEQVNSLLPRKNVGITVMHDGYEGTDKSIRNLGILLMQLEITPNDPYILYQTARQYRVIKQYHDAYHFFTKMYKVIDKDVNFFADAIISYIYTLIEVRQFDTGLSILEEVRGQLINYPDFHFVCGIFYLNLALSNIEKYKNFLPLIEKSFLDCLNREKEEIVIGTSSFLAEYNLGVYHEILGNFIRATFWYEKSANTGYQPALRRLELIKMKK